MEAKHPIRSREPWNKGTLIGQKASPSALRARPFGDLALVLPMTCHPVLRDGSHP